MAEKPSSKKMAAAAPAAKTAAPVAKKDSSPAPAVQQVSKSSGNTAAAAAPAKAKVDPKERQRLIAEAAYYLAMKRHFAPGHEVQDWVAAEKQVDALLAKR